RDVLVRIRRHNESRARLRLARLRAPLHLARILDARLVFGRQRERGPFLRVLQRARAIAVVRDLHLDRALDLHWIAVGLARALVERRQQGVAVELRALARRADEAVRLFPRELRDLRTGARDVQRHRLLRLVEDLRLARAVVLALEGHVVL